MDHFAYRNGTLHVEEVPIERIAAEAGTPFYCYSTATLKERAQTYADALKAIDPMICFAVKANSNIAVLRVLAKAGLGADIVSGGELDRALEAGIPPKKVVFSGSGKSEEDIAFALEHDIFQFNVESLTELKQISEIATKMKRPARVALRINPDVDAGAHDKTTTGREEDKFGIAIGNAESAFALAESLPNILVRGISVHIGSGTPSLQPYEDAYRKIRELVERQNAKGKRIYTIDIGGGLGVNYGAPGEVPPPTPKAYGAMVARVFEGVDADFIVEPGRFICAYAGVLVSRVNVIKQAAHTHVVLDAGMNDLVRPAMYDAYHAIQPVKESKEPLRRVHVVGPVCESSCAFHHDIELPMPRENDLMVLRTAGAYGASMSSNYNTRPLTPEVLVDGERFHVIRKKQTRLQMREMEEMAPWLEPPERASGRPKSR